MHALETLFSKWSLQFQTTTQLYMGDVYRDNDSRHDYTYTQLAKGGNHCAEFGLKRLERF